MAIFLSDIFQNHVKLSLLFYFFSWCRCAPGAAIIMLQLVLLH